jgi:integrase
MAYVAKKVRTRYVLEVGKKKKFVPKGTPGAKRKLFKSDDYYGFWATDGGRKESVRFRNCRDKAAAQGLLHKHLRELALHRADLGPHPREAKAAAGTPIEEHFQAYLRHLRELGRADRYVAEVERQAREVFTGVGAGVLADLTPEKVHPYLSVLSKKPTANNPDPGPASARTKDTYRQAVCYFTAWLAKPSVRRLSRDPLADMEPYRGVKVRSRRALDESDLQRLLDAARERPLANAQVVRKGKKKGKPAKFPEDHKQYLTLCGLQRALVYKTAALTLARFGAIRLLTVDALHLDADRPHAVFPARNVKRRREIVKPLPPELVQDLREWLALTGRKGSDRVFDLNSQVTRELRKDLEYAGIPYKDGLGRTFDFHALKKCGVTALARANVNLLSAKDYAEHSDVRLTTEAYRDAAAQPMDEVFRGLPKVK